MTENQPEGIRKAWKSLLGSGASISFVTLVLQVAHVVRQEDFSTLLLAVGAIASSLVLAIFLGRRRKVSSENLAESSLGIGEVKNGALFEKAALVLTSLSIAGMAITVVVSLVTGNSTPRPRGIDGLAPSSALVPSPSAAPLPVASGEICNVNGSYPVEVVNVRSRDGKAGISSDLIVDMIVRTPPKFRHEYWLFSKVVNGPGNFVYVAKDQMPEGVGTYSVGVLLPKSGPGSVRDFFVADGGPDNLTWLQANKLHGGDPSWDYPNRISLHGVMEVSNACTIQKTRD